MIKLDETEFKNLIISNGGRVPRDLWDHLTKRHYYLLKKWHDRGEWEFGVSVRSGWLINLTPIKDQTIS